MEKISRTYRIIILWMLLIIGYILHAIYHLSEIFFGIDIKLPEANGTVPPIVHLFRIVLEVGTMIIVLFWLKTQHQFLVWFSFVWSVLLFILNAVHWVEALSTELNNYSQVALLLVILIVNGFLSWELWQKIRLKNSLHDAA